MSRILTATFVVDGTGRLLSSFESRHSGANDIRYVIGNNICNRVCSRKKKYKIRDFQIYKGNKCIMNALIELNEL